MIVARCSLPQNIGRSVSDTFGGAGQIGILLFPAVVTNTGGRHVFPSGAYGTFNIFIILLLFFNLPLKSLYPESQALHLAPLQHHSHEHPLLNIQS